MRAIGVTAILAFLLDQFSKYYVVHMLELARIREIYVLPPYLNFIYAENRGVNFGLGDWLGKWTLIGVAVGICIWLLWWMRSAQTNLAGRIGAGLIVGGALGNVFDRLVYGYVLDFLNMSCCGINNPYSFNVADIFIFAGAGLVLIFTRDAQKPA